MRIAREGVPIVAALALSTLAAGAVAIFALGLPTGAALALAAPIVLAALFAAYCNKLSQCLSISLR